MIEIIPAIDIMDASCVRLTQGKYDRKTVYQRDPLAVAKRFEAAGMRRLHCVDLDAARLGHVVNTDTVEAICRGTGLRVDVGGGIKTAADVERLFAAGAAQITAGSIAVEAPARVSSWLKTYGAEKIILGADFRNGRISVSGWQKDSSLELMDFLESYVSRGIKTVISTDISRDGMLGGSAETTYLQIKRRFPDLYLIASGGVASVEDIRRLETLDIDGVIVGKALYEGRIRLQQLREFTC